jgi:hypothetical protein
LFHPFTTSEESQLGNHESWHDAYNTYESLINDVHFKFIYKFKKYVYGSENWEDLELHAYDLAQINNDNIWMDKFDSVDEFFSSKPITNCIEIEHYDIGCEFHIKTQCTLSIILCTIEKRDELIPNEFFYFQLQKLNKKQRAIFDNCMYKKRMHMNQPIHLFLIGGAGTGKTFTLLFMIQGFLRHCNKKISYNPLKQNTILMMYTGKTTFNIDGINIHSGLSFPLNCKHLQSLSTKRLDYLLKIYDELQLLVLNEVSLIGSKIFCLK